MQAIKFLLFPKRARLIRFSNDLHRLSHFRYCNAYYKSFPILNSVYAPRTSYFVTPFSEFPPIPSTKTRYFSTSHEKTGKNDVQEDEESPQKLSLYQRYKKMFKEYWYVLLPVHFVTSAVWFGGFYYASTCGLDIVPFLEYINLPEKFISPLRKSSLGHIAVASILYKLVTPARYMVTVVGSTFTVNILKKRGLIRPAPTKAEIKTIIQNKLKKDGVSDKDN